MDAPSLISLLSAFVPVRMTGDGDVVDQVRVARVVEVFGRLGGHVDEDAVDLRQDDRDRAGVAALLVQLVCLVEKALPRQADLTAHLVPLVERPDAVVEADEDEVVVVVGLDQELLSLLLDLAFLDQRRRCSIRLEMSEPVEIQPCGASAAAMRSGAETSWR